MDRFDFEQSILNCWRVTDDVKDVSGAIFDGSLDPDQSVTILNGIRLMYEMKFDKLWEGFETVHMGLVRQNKMLEDECQALREQLAELGKGNDI